MPTDLEDFNTSSDHLELDEADDAVAVAGAATAGTSVQVCSPWDSMLRWYDCLTIEPFDANSSGQSLQGSMPATTLLSTRTQLPDTSTR